MDRPIIIWSGPSGGGGAPPPGAFTATLTRLFPLEREIGEQLASPTFNATYSAATVTAVLDDDDGNPTEDVQGVGNPITMPFNYQENANNAARVWTLTGDDGVNPVDSDQATSVWRPRIWWGTDASAALSTEADIEGLGNSELSADKALSVVASPVIEYLYYAVPVSYGPVNVLDFQFGAFPGGFVQVQAAVNVTANTAGAPAQNYELWRSQFALDTTVSGPQPFTVS